MRATDPMVCRELVERVTDYLEDDLSRDDRARVEAHLAECSGCSEYLGQMRETLALTGRLQPEQLSSQTRQALQEAFRRRRPRG